MNTLSISLWAANLELPAENLNAWVASVEARMAEAQAAGAQLLVLHEFACSQWLGFMPAGLPLNQHYGNGPCCAAKPPPAWFKKSMR